MNDGYYWVRYNGHTYHRGEVFIAEYKYFGWRAEGHQINSTTLEIMSGQITYPLKAFL